MSGEVRVNTDELRMTADQLDMHAADLADSHATAHANMASVVPGFGTSLSAAALNNRIAHWESETAEHHAELQHHRDGHQVACAHYAKTDGESSEQITAAADALDEAARAQDL